MGLSCKPDLGEMRYLDSKCTKVENGYPSIPVSHFIMSKFPNLFQPSSMDGTSAVSKCSHLQSKLP